MELTAHDVVGGYGGRDVIRSVSLALRPGEVVGLVGPNGAGKSTLLRLLTGRLRCRAGSVELCGRPVHQMAALDVARTVAVVPQSEPTLFEFAAREVVLMGRNARVDRKRGETAGDFDAAAAAMAATDCLHLADRPVTDLSGGEHRRVLIARAVAQDCPFVLLDEPTAHLDLTHQADVLRLLRRLADREGRGVLAALHDLNLAAEYCHRLLLLCGGRLVAQGPPARVLEPATIERAYGAPVTVARSPASGRPHVFVAPAVDAAAAGGLHVHVVCGGGTGLEVMSGLVRGGFHVTAGVLNRLDTDEEGARALGVECALEAPFMAIGSAARAEGEALMAQADAVVVTDVPLGRGNLANLELARLAQERGVPVLLLGRGPDFSEGQGAALLEAIEAGGAATASDLQDLEAQLRRLEGRRPART